MDLVAKAFGLIRGKNVASWEVARGFKRYFRNILKHSLFSFLLMPSWLSSSESFMCIRKSHGSRRYTSFLYLTMCPDPMQSPGDEKTQFQRWDGSAHVLSK